MALSGNSISKMIKSHPDKQMGYEETSKLSLPFNVLRRMMLLSKQSLNENNDQDSEIHKDAGTRCECDFCSTQESPIVASDGLLFRCRMKGESHIPTEVVEFSELIGSLQKRIAAIGTRRRSLSGKMRLHPTGHEGISSKDRNNNNNKASLFTFRSRSSSETYSPAPISGRWAEKSRTKSGINRVQSTPSLDSTPNSILLKYNDKQLITSSSMTDFLGSPNDESEKTLRTKYTEQLTWFKENGRDFVALESMKTLNEVSALLCVLAESKSPTLIRLRVTCNQMIMASYQFLDKFKQEFMLLKVGGDYCMFMAPF